VGVSTVQIAAQGVRARRALLSRKWRRTLWFYLFVLPWLLGFVLLWVVPLGLGFVTSLTDYDGLNLATVRFVGLRHYVNALTRDKDAAFSFGQTLKWTALNLPTWMILSFVLALILNQNVRGKGFFRTAFFFPSIIPLVAMMWIWKIVLDRNVGLLNAAISIFRPGTAISWLTEYGLQGLTVIAVWSGLGWGMLIFLAGLQGVPDELVEAARIDGAGALAIFRHVTIPLMTPVIFYVLVSGLIGSFQQFIMPQLLAAIGGRTGAGFEVIPPRPIYLAMIHVNRQIFSFQRFGYGIALLWLLFIIVALLTVVLFRTSRYWVYTESRG
jgi:multiple sugar transport system permease protein